MSNITISTRKAFGNVSNVKKKVVKSEKSKIISLKGENGKETCSDTEKPLKKSQDVDSYKKVATTSSTDFEQENGPDCINYELENEMAYHPMSERDKKESDYFQLHEIFDEPPISIEADLIDGKRAPLKYIIDFDLL